MTITSHSLLCWAWCFFTRSDEARAKVPNIYTHIIIYPPWLDRLKLGDTLFTSCVSQSTIISTECFFVFFLNSTIIPTTGVSLSGSLFVLCSEVVPPQLSLSITVVKVTPCMWLRCWAEKITWPPLDFISSSLHYCSVKLSTWLKQAADNCLQSN